MEINKELFLADYEKLLAEKDEVASKADFAVQGLSYNEDIKTKVFDLLVEEGCKEINEEISLYEKYILKGEE